MLYNLHLLRAFAALSVVYFHTASGAGLNLPVQIGAAGVDVFFVISGFIITHVSRRSADHFLLRRLIRVVPFYWVGTLGLFAVALLLPQVLRQTAADWSHLLHSLLFLPYAKPDGTVYPLMILGWTLNYEMYFYVVFACCLAISQRWAPLLSCATIVAVMICIRAIDSDSRIAAFYADPIVLEFCFGIGIHYLWRARPWAMLSPMQARLASAALALGSVVALGVAEAHGALESQRALRLGVPAALLVWAALEADRLRRERARIGFGWTLGEASYVLYLSHPYVIYGVLRLLVPQGAVPGGVATALLAVAMIVLSTAVAVGLHRWVEWPLMEAMRRRLLDPRPRRVPAGAGDH